MLDGSATQDYVAKQKAFLQRRAAQCQQEIDAVVKAMPQYRDLLSVNARLDEIEKVTATYEPKLAELQKAVDELKAADSTDEESEVKDG